MFQADLLQKESIESRLEATLLNAEVGARPRPHEAMSPQAIPLVGVKEGGKAGGGGHGAVPWRARCFGRGTLCQGAPLQIIVFLFSRTRPRRMFPLEDST